MLFLYQAVALNEAAAAAEAGFYAGDLQASLFSPASAAVVSIRGFNGEGARAVEILEERFEGVELLFGG